MKELTLRLESGVSLESILDLLQPDFDILIRQKDTMDLVLKRQPSQPNETAVKSSPTQKRKTQPMNGFMDGKSYSEISVELDININNLRYYIKKIYRKLGVNSAAEAIRTYKASLNANSSPA